MTDRKDIIRRYLEEQEKYDLAFYIKLIKENPMMVNQMEDGRLPLNEEAAA
jgi:hypothetical protein